MKQTLPIVLLTGLLTTVGNNHAAAQTGSNVLLVINDTSSVSNTIGEYYMRKRNVPPANVCHITVKVDETIQRGEYDRLIQQPIAKCITSGALHDRVLYIVLTKGVPLRIDGTGGRDGSIASVDSELTLLYRRQTGIAAAVQGTVPNPYFAGSAPANTVSKPFTHEVADIYLVTRLDGYTVEDVIGLIDRASAPSKDGRILLDERSSWRAAGNSWLKAAAESLTAMGFGDRVELDDTAKVLKDETNVLGYCSWGSNDPAIRTRHLNLKFVPGAIASMFVSTDARTFQEPAAGWNVGDPTKLNASTWGSHQSLTGDLIREGVTGVAGHVAEPYLDATIRPDLLMPAYLSGANLAEAFYQAMPYLSWQTVVIGDPLTAPFRARSLAADEIDKGLDKATELPLVFSGRRIKVAEGMKVNREATTAFLRYETRLARGDAAGARRALEEAIAAEPRFITAHEVLGMSAQTDGELDEAAKHYKAAIALNANAVVSLNNLAYLLAVDRNAPREALPLAERANAIAKNQPVLLDTLGWIHHLLGNDAEASRLLYPAAAAAPTSAEIHWHTAVVAAALQDLARAATELDIALKLEPKLAEREDLRKLRERVASKAPARD